MNPTCRRATLAAVLLPVLWLAATGHAKTASEVYEQAARSTVVVENIDAQGKAQSMGSGVVLPDGDVVTNCHVVKGANRLKVRIGAKEHPATLRYSDWDRDVCSLSAPGLSAPAVVVGSSKTLKVGAKVYAIGAPKGLSLTLSDGIVSSLRPVDGGHYIQTTAAISPGSSGGGLFDENGALVGLTTFYLAEGQNLNFAVPVEWVKDLAQRSTKAAATATATAQPVTQWMNKAIELESRKDWPALLEHSLRWTKAQPGNAVAWYGLGFAYDKAGQSARSIDAFQQALRIDPKYANVWFALGVIYGKAGQSAKEIEAYQQALRINPENADTWYNLGVTFLNVGQSAKAIEAFQQVLRINPENSDTWYNLGVIYFNIGQSAKAIDAYQQALRINPEYAEAWSNLGAAYARAGQTPKAIEAFQQVRRINPENADAWYNLGLTYVKVGQFAKAIEAYQQALRINPENAEAWNNLGKTYCLAEQCAKAIEAFQQALRINPENADTWYVLGISYSQTGQRGKVLEVYKRLKTLDPVLAERFFKGFVML